MDSKYISYFEKFIYPLLLILVSFTPTIYSRLTEPTLHYVYDVKIVRNPVDEWNRQLDRLLKQLDKSENNPIDKIPAPLLKRIGEEVYKSLPVMLSGIGFHPNDSVKVRIMNVADQGLRNIRVHFNGCDGFVTYETWPDSVGSIHNPNKSGIVSSEQVTLRYDKLAPSYDRDTNSMAQIIFYGESTDVCVPKVEAELADGRSAVGKKESLHEYLNQVAWDKHDKEREINTYFRFFVVLLLLYVFVQMRKIKNRLNIS